MTQDIQSGVAGGVLAGEELKKLGIISENAYEKSYRGISYDLRIGKMIDPEGKVVTEYKLPPRGMIEVISTERIHLPPEIVGTAMVKTSLGQAGILALGIGVIDPGWNGHISSYLINFGKGDYFLSEGEVFLRTLFQRIEGKSGSVKDIEKSLDEALIDCKKAMCRTGGSFLNLSEELDKLTKEHEDKRWLKTLTYVSLGAFILAVITFLSNFATMGTAGKPATSTMVVSQTVASELEALRQENENLQKRLMIIETRIANDEVIRSKNTDSKSSTSAGE